MINSSYVTFIQCCCIRHKSEAICATLLFQRKQTALSAQPWLGEESYDCSSNWLCFTTFTVQVWEITGKTCHQQGRRRCLGTTVVWKLKTVCKKGESSIISLVDTSADSTGWLSKSGVWTSVKRDFQFSSKVAVQTKVKFEFLLSRKSGKGQTDGNTGLS